MLKMLRDVRALVAEANKIAAQDPGDAPRWSLFLTNRSFILLAVAVALNVAQFFGVPLPDFVGPNIADQIVALVTALLTLWAFIERVLGKTRVVWSKRQAKKAVEEAVAVTQNPQAVVVADELTQALEQAGAYADR